MATVRLKETSIPVIPHMSGISKNVSSTFMKHDSQQQHTASVKAYPETTVVIQPGSRYLKIGKAKAAFPVIIPHCIAYKTNNNGTSDSGISMEIITNGDASVSVEWFDEQVSQLYTSRTKKLPPNFYQNLRAFNEQQSKTNQKIPIHNDSFHIDYTVVRDGGKFVCGVEALRLDPRGDQGWRVKWPLSGGRFAYNWRESMEDMQRIWTTCISEHLQIPMGDLPKWSVVVVVDDHVSVKEVKAYTEMCVCTFKSVAFLRAGQAACIGAGTSSGLIVDCGAQKTAVSVVEDGVVVAGSVVGVGGDSMVRFFYDLLTINRFPCRLNFDLNRPLDFELIEQELWLKVCSLDEENELTATAASVPIEFFRRHPGADTTVHSVKMLDERCLPLLALFESNFGRLAKHHVESGHCEDLFILSEPLQSVMEESTGNGGSVIYECDNLVDMIEKCTATLYDNPERLQKITSALLFTGGALPSHTLPFFSPKIPIAMERLDPGIDARQVAWKGGAVLAKLDSFPDYCVDGAMWRCKGERVFADKLSFNIF